MVVFCMRFFHRRFDGLSFRSAPHSIFKLFCFHGVSRACRAPRFSSHQPVLNRAPSFSGHQAVLNLGQCPGNHEETAMFSNTKFSGHSYSSVKSMRSNSKWCAGHSYRSVEAPCKYQVVILLHAFGNCLSFVVCGMPRGQLRALPCFHAWRERGND